MTKCSGWRRRTCVILWLGAASAALLPFPATRCCAQGFSVINTVRTARTFYPGERVVLTLQAGGPRQAVNGTVTDYAGQVVKRVRLAVGEGVPQKLDLGLGWDLGLYYLSLSYASGQTQQDAFCVLPRPDFDRGEYEVFSWHCVSGDGAVWRALAQAGVRVVRRDLAWPNLEQYQDQVDMSLPASVVSLAQDNGIQLIPILGYTPGWDALRPENATGRAAGAAHCWAPGHSSEWRDYAANLADYLGSKTVTWPAPNVLYPLTAASSETLPLVHSWEIWNEADQAFYYGPWNRYVDLLRIAHGEIKRRDPWATILHGGSTGHWTETGMTYNYLGQWFFDRLAFHPGGSDPDTYFDTYFAGAPQIGNAYGIFHGSTMTESYPGKPAGVSYAQYMFQLYALLRKWNVDTYCCFYGGHLVGDPDPSSSAMLWYQNGVLTPNARYVAFAVARWLFCGATYVGPLSLGEGVTAYLYLRGGNPLVVAWANAATPVTLPAVSGAYTLNEMGRRTQLTLTNGQISLTLGPVPQAVLGLDLSLVATALHTQVETVLTTPQGWHSGRYFGYIGTLETDVAWAGSGWGSSMRTYLFEAEGQIRRGLRRGGSALGLLQTETLNQLKRGLQSYIATGGPDWRAASCLWRLETLAEYLGKVQDAYELCYGGRPPRANVDLLAAGIEALRSTVAGGETGQVQPLALQSLQRARAALQRVQRGAGNGAFATATGEYEAAQLLGRSEPLQLLGVVAAPDFATSTQLVKGMMLRPGVEQEVRLHLYNFTTAAVSGSLTLELPAEWGSTPAAVPFTVPAGARSDTLTVRFTIPSEGDWINSDGWTGVGNIPLRRPPGLNSEQHMYLKGTLSDGRRLLTTPYYTLVGALP